MDSGIGGCNCGVLVSPFQLKHKHPVCVCVCFEVTPLFVVLKESQKETSLGYPYVKTCPFQSCDLDSASKQDRSKLPPICSVQRNEEYRSSDQYATTIAVASPSIARLCMSIISSSARKE